MKAVILAAGQGTRVSPLSDNYPKVLLPVAGKPSIFHTFDSVVDFVDEIIVVDNKEGKLKENIGDLYNGKKISYAIQENPRGTGDSLKHANITGKFIVMMGDDIYSKEDVASLLPYDLAIAVMPTNEPHRFGIVKEQNGFMTDLVEKPKDLQTGLANNGLYLLDERIFDELKNVKESLRGEIELTDAVASLARKTKISVVQIKDWIPVTYSWNLLEANEKLLAKMKGGIEGVVEQGATLKGEVHVGKGSVVKAGSYIEGPVWIGENSTVGPNCYLRASTMIGNNCYVGNAVEIKNSIIMNGTHVGHLSYVGDSVVGEKCNFGAGTITANLRYDGQPVKMTVKGERISTGRRKMGVIMGHGAKTGIHVSIMPGVKIKSGAMVAPHTNVERDVE